ncbi:E3 ubiquitin-protein ligase SPL2-like [Ananas comosus]|uniref:RING-type E3 ubiquitin transferase n=1 Tax=Ananas comosus TaxID=4615 RepID=A0A6P5G8X0_ANACO|nr:E3 ubiquitin-protein ligase SPL2-like [Ananas comosus]
MSSRDNETAAAIARAATSFDGAVLGIGLALCAASTWAKYFATSHALRRIRLAPSAPISDLRSLLPSSSSDDDEAALIVVRGHVQPRSAVDGPPWASAKSFGSLVSQGSGERAVIVKQTQTCLYNEWRGIFGWSFDLHAIFAKSWKEQRTSSFRSVPFILVEGGRWPRSGYVHVNLDGSDHPLPLTTVYHQLHPIQATPYTLFQAIFGNGYPVALLDEEKILPVGKEITAVGFCRTRDGALEVKSCQELPFFLSEMTKDEIEAELATNTAALLWSGILLGTLSIGILGYAIARNWSRWKEWRERRKRDRELRNQAASVPSGMEEELGEVPDGELCVICLMRRRRSAFIPCGHLVCCPSCALTVERDSFPKCPVCRQSIRSSIRIYDS